MRVHLFKLEIADKPGWVIAKRFGYIDSDKIKHIYYNDCTDSEFNKDEYFRFGIFGCTRVDIENEEDNNYCILTSEAKELLGK